MPLKGLAFVVDDVEKGPKLVFRYPTFSKATGGAAASSKRNSVGLSSSVLARPISSLKPTPLINNPFRFDLLDSNLSTASEAPPADYGACVLGVDNPFGAFQPDLLAWIFRPRDALCNKVFELEIDGTIYLSHPVLLKNQKLRLFNVVFAVSSDDVGPTVLKAYKDVITRITSTLLHEENRCGYVSSEVKTMLKVWTRIQHKTSRNASGKDCSSTATVLELDHNSVKGANGLWNDKQTVGVSVDMQSVVDVCLGCSLLACNMKDIFHKLRHKHMAQVMVNGWVPLSISLRDPDMHPSMPLRPYQTLLLLKDDSQIIDSLPKDASPQIRMLVEVANPLKSFEELYIESGIPLAQLFRLAAHLVYWGCGRVVDTLTKHNVYMVNPAAELSPHSPLALEFKLKFRPTTLPGLLSKLSVRPAKVGDFLRGLTATEQLRFIKMLIWLLRHDFLVQLHTYIHLVIPKAWIKQHLEEVGTGIGGVDAATTERAALDTDNEARLLGSSMAPLSTQEAEGISRPNAGSGHTSGRRQYESAYLESIADETPVFQLFKRLAPYFRGRHTVEEIMWRETTSRAAIQSVFATYSNVLVSVLHPKAVTEW